MLGIDGRALRVCWTVFLFAVVLVAVYLIRGTLVDFALAIFFAYLLAPLVNLVERFLPKRRNLALAIVYVAILAVLITVGINLGSRIAEEAGSLASRLPAMVQNATFPQFPIPSWLDPYKNNVYQAAQNEARELSSGAVPLLQRATGRIISGLGAVLVVVLVPILAFFFLKDGRAISAALIGSVTGGRRQGLLEGILMDIHELLSKYIRALVILALASGTAWFLFLQILGTPYSLLLAGLCGTLEFIPVIGPAAGGLTVVVVAAVTSSGGYLWIILFWIVYRMFQDYVLNPHLMSEGVEVHPLLVLFGVLAGEQIAGIPGMFFSVPVIAILKAVFTRLRTAPLTASPGSPVLLD
jgi:predicted PurR-regulated permease PerM